MGTYEITFRTRKLDGTGRQYGTRASGDASIEDMLDLAEDLCGEDYEDICSIVITDIILDVFN